MTWRKEMGPDARLRCLYELDLAESGIDPTLPLPSTRFTPWWRPGAAAMSKAKQQPPAPKPRYCPFCLERMVQNPRPKKWECQKRECRKQAAGARLRWRVADPRKAPPLTPGAFFGKAMAEGPADKPKAPAGDLLTRPFVVAGPGFEPGTFGL